MGANFDANKQNRKKLLVFSPHPDDLELSAGLMCFEAVSLGWDVLEVVITDGAAGGINPKIFHTQKLCNIRQKEAMVSARLLGVQRIEFLGYPDGGLVGLFAQLSVRLLEIVESYKPSLICLPGKYDLHSDHQAVYRVMSNYLGVSIPQLHYCFWGKDRRRKIALVSDAGVRVKLKAILAHQSQPVAIYLQRQKRDITEQEPLSEYFYAPNYKKTKNFLISSGFKIF